MRYLALLTAMIVVAIWPELPLLKNSSQHVDEYEYEYKNKFKYRNSKKGIVGAI